MVLFSGPARPSPGPLFWRDAVFGGRNGWAWILGDRSNALSPLLLAGLLPVDLEIRGFQFYILRRLFIDAAVMMVWRSKTASPFQRFIARLEN